MDEPSAAAALDDRSDGEPRGGPRRIWFPILWPLLLAAIAAGFWHFAEDPGVTNTVIHIAVALAVVGLAIWTVRSSGLPRGIRWPLAAISCGLLAAFYLQVLPIKLINNGDIGIAGWTWRWSTPDRQLTIPASTAAAKLEWIESPHDYAGFLGNRYCAHVDGVELQTDWQAHPPRQLWKQPIGAGWSAFAIVGNYAVTQEQRGDQELVVCYEARTSKPMWTHADNVRWDPRGPGSLGEIGPRATPTIHDGKIFTHGATGILNCLDARSGEVIWSHDTLAENGAENLMWGKAGSPLIVDDRVIVSVGGLENKSLVAYSIPTGKRIWAAGSRRSSYATPVLVEIAGVRQIVCVNENFVTAHRADDGQQLWEHPWPGESDSNASCSQPVPVGDDRILLSKGYSLGAELIQITRDNSGHFSTKTVWKNPAVLRTKMANVVIRDGYVYGLSDGLLQCVELKSGKNKWKKRRSPKIANGQILLVGDVILVLTEQGEIVLVEATPERYHELAAMPAIEGVTWNNPALSGNLLLVRNAQEAACFELPLREPADVAAR